MYNNCGRFLVGKDEKIDVEEIEKKRTELVYKLNVLKNDIREAGGKFLLDSLDQNKSTFECRLEFWPIYRTGGFELERLL